MERVVKQFYSDGVQHREYNFFNNKRHGMSTEWYPTGIKKSEISYVYGEIDGIAKSWYNNGQLESETIFTNERKKGQTITWYKNGCLCKKVNFINGHEVGIVESFVCNIKNGRNSLTTTKKSFIHGCEIFLFYDLKKQKVR